MKKLNLIALILIMLLTACGKNGNIKNSGLNPEPLPPVTDGTIPLDSDISIGNVYLAEVQLFIMESFPIQVSVNIVGNLPTPCHNFNYLINLPNENNEIIIEVFSEVALDQVCIEVLDPFEENISIPLDNFEDGIYSVYVNNEFVGEFSYPG